MSDDNTPQTRRTVLQKGAVAGGLFTLGGVAAAGTATADKPDISRSVEVTFTNPCTGEDATDTDAREVIDSDVRTDSSGGMHVNLKFTGKGRFVGEDTGLIYEGSIHGSQNAYVAADALPQTVTTVLRFKVISRGSASNFLAKLTAKTTISAAGVESVNTEWSSEECL